MFTKSQLLAIAISVIAGLLVLRATPVRAAAALVVDDDKQQCPDAAFTRIQDAVNAAPPGATIEVCPGTYREQVTIAAGKDGLTLRSKVPLAAIIQAPPVMTDPGDIVHVAGAHDVTIRAFTITGPLPDAEFCSLFARTGVRVDGGGSANILRNHITEVRSANPALRGCQNGVAILVGRRFEGQVGSATIRENFIDKYQKNGPTVDNAGSHAAITRNIIEGIGSTPVIAQNGIQVSRGATAEVRENEVFDNIFALPTDAATGIILFRPGSVLVAENVLTTNDIGLDVDAAINPELSKNRTSGGADDGIDLVDGTTGARVAENRSTNNGEFGFFADDTATDNNLIENEASANKQFDCRDDSKGAGTAGTANFWKDDEGKSSSPPGICKPEQEDEDHGGGGDRDDHPLHPRPHPHDG